MRQPPPPESLVFSATRYVLGWIFALVCAVLVGVGAASLLPPTGRAAVVAASQVPSLGWTTDAGQMLPGVQRATLGSLPSPGPNQKRAGTCNPKAAQVEINGGCWVKTETPPPCPDGIQWEYENRCWLPVAPAARPPTSGGTYPVNVADE